MLLITAPVFTVLTVYPEESRIFTQEDKKNIDKGEQSERYDYLFT